MNILLRYSLGFDLWILGLLLQVFHCVFLVQSSLDYNARYSTTSMPVITRSKSRLATDSSKELSTANSSNSSKEFWIQHQINRQRIHLRLISFLLLLIHLQHLVFWNKHHLHIYRCLHCLDIMMFQKINFKIRIWNFEISKSL